MRFRKGDKVEVMNKKEAEISWNTAEILSGNGITYRVQYDFYCGLPSEQLAVTVSCKLVRPCPPLVQGVEHYDTGDIVEVFYESSWKISAILKILGGKIGNMSNEICFQDASFQNQYLVRLLGCSKELIIAQSDIRTRQTWHDERWFLMEKCCRGGEDFIARMNFEVPEGDGKVKNRPHKDCLNNPDDISFLKLSNISSRPQKRKLLYQSSTIAALDGRVGKLREIQKDGKELRLVAAPMLEKVDAVASPRELLSGKNMHASFNITSNGYNQKERRKQKDVLDFSGVRNSESNGSDSDACSVGSCSITDRCPNNFHSHLNPPFWQDTDTLSSDAESVCSGIERKRCSLPPNEEIEVYIHKLELHAYRCTLEVLYASGPLSWEQETLLTNLRITLHISNDEHLKELKHLISAKTAVFGLRLDASIICFQRFKEDARVCHYSSGINFWTLRPSTFKQMQTTFGHSMNLQFSVCLFYFSINWIYLHFFCWMRKYV